MGFCPPGHWARGSKAAIEGSDRRQRSKDRRPETIEGPGHDGITWAMVGSSGLWALGSGLWALGWFELGLRASVAFRLGG